MFNYSSSMLLRQYYQEEINIPYHLQFISIYPHPEMVTIMILMIEYYVYITYNYVFLYPQIYYYVLCIII